MKMAWFWLLAVVMIAAGVYHSLRIKDQVKLVEQTGFHVDKRFFSSPSLALDDQHQQLALIYSQRFEVRPYKDVVAFQRHYRTLDHGNNQGLYIALYWQQSDEPMLLKADRESEWDAWSAELRQRFDERPTVMALH
ncbi:hypothetical protein QCD60_03075 [Pokkaliibacter sp. MBI-7]|uniref:hypothetical protein n=1 Tax=Pokkaliibacter sp. MBI-7 TaxID=3040600 RepID=UPI00244A6738|nr:hypothetical protein [Pokkaliibacter sp. MBI-7]MDH2431542.1 hypothetical protein [Pokkaliibacter sp. MBI-7]